MCQGAAERQLKGVSTSSGTRYYWLYLPSGNSLLSVKEVSFASGLEMAEGEGGPGITMELKKLFGQRSEEER